MIVIERKRLGLKITEAYFAEEPSQARLHTDVVMYVRCASPGPGLSEARTLLIDLTADEDSILSGCAKTTRYEIRRAARDHVRCELLAEPTPEQVAAFAAFYDVFADRKKRPRAGRKRLVSLRQTGALAISMALDEGGRELVYHAYVMDRESSRAMLLHSASHFRDYEDSAIRQDLGRANRYLCWMDMVSFKKLGIRVYDLGGVPPDDANRELQQIAAFKRGFGGREVAEYSGQQGVTLLGRIACLVRG